MQTILHLVHMAMVFHYIHFNLITISAKGKVLLLPSTLISLLSSTQAQDELYQPPGSTQAHPQNTFQQVTAQLQLTSTLRNCYRRPQGRGQEHMAGVEGQVREQDYHFPR